MFKFTEIGFCKNTVIEQINLTHPKFNAINGDLFLLLELSTGMLLLKMGNFQYGINPNDRIVYEDKDPNFKLQLCLDYSEDRCWVVKLNDNVQLVYSVLSERCRLINKTASNIIVQKINAQQQPQYLPQQPNVHANYMKFKNLQFHNDTKQISSPPEYFEEKPIFSQHLSTSMILIQASKSLSSGLVKAGSLIGKGLQAFAGFLARRVEPSENIILSEQTKMMIDKSTKSSKKILQVATEKFTQLFRIGKNEANKLITKTQQGNQAVNNTSYKNKLLTGLHIVANIYEGLTEGLSQAGNGLAKGTTQIVGVKYGPQVEDASFQLIEGGRNIYRIGNIPQNVIVKDIIQSAQRQEDKKFNPTQAVIKKL